MKVRRSADFSSQSIKCVKNHGTSFDVNTGVIECADMSTVSIWAVRNCHCVGCVNPSQNPGAENWLFTSSYLVRITDLGFSKPAV